MLKRFLCTLLAGLMLIPLASCESSSTAKETIAMDGSEETDRYLDDLPEALDFNEYNVRFLVEEGTNGNLSALSIHAEEASGDVVENAVFTRNNIIKERLNIDITLIDALPVFHVAPLVNASISAGTHDYDVAGLYQYFGAGYAASGYFLDISDFSYNNFDREYWGTKYIDAMSYKGRIFWVTGDISLRYTGGMYVTYVNDRLWENYYADTNVYDMVDKGTWTIDKMYDLSSAIYVDTNFNGEQDADDTFGLSLIYNDLIDGMCAGLLVQFGSIDENGDPYVSVANEYTYAAYEKLYTLTHNNSGYFLSAYDDSITLMKKYSEGRYLMTVNKLYQSGIYLRDMEDSFKIIPLPKFDETQSYYNTRIHDSVTLYGVPTTAYGNTDVISATLEAMASESYRLVRPAYYEVALKTKYQRDSDAGRMIDLIAENVSTDFVTLYSHMLADVNQVFSMHLAADSENMASNLRSYARTWKTAMRSLLNNLETAADQ